MLRGQLAGISDATRNLKSLNGPKPKQYGKLVFTNLQDVKVEKVDWIWRGFIAKGNLHLYAGEGGIGKSRSLFNLSAVISRGGVFPAMSEKCTAGKVIYVSAEDSLSQTIKPQFVACNGNQDNFEVLDTQQTDGTPLTLVEIINHLTEYVLDNAVALIIIDPVTALMAENFDNNSPTSVRRVTHQLRNMAEATGVAIIAVTHLNKGTHMKAVHRVLGSGGWTHHPRIVMGAIEKDGEFLFGKLKANITDRRGVYRWEMTESRIDGLPDPVTHIEWLDDETEFDKELSDYEEISTDGRGQRGDQALLVMEEYMDVGKFFRKEDVIREVRKQVHISAKQIQRMAFEVLKVESSRENVQNGKALWRIPLETYPTL